MFFIDPALTSISSLLAAFAVGTYLKNSCPNKKYMHFFFVRMPYFMADALFF